MVVAAGEQGIVKQPGWYSRQGLWTLFLMAALPLHLWTLILVLNDFAWVAERTDAWDAVGVGAYGLLYALIESIVVFFGLLLLGFLLPKSWSENKRISTITLLYLITAVWAMIGQIYFLIEDPMPQGVFQFLVESGHPLRIMYAAALVLAGVSVTLPMVWVIRSHRATQLLMSMIGRLGMLSIFYLLFDVLAVIVVLIRNLP